MNQNNPGVPPFQPPVSQAVTQPAAKNNKQFTLALWLLVGPTALIIGSILFYAIVNVIISATGADASAIRTILNVLLFLVGAVAVIAWLPGIIAGIILLATQKKD